MQQSRAQTPAYEEDWEEEWDEDDYGYSEEDYEEPNEPEVKEDSEEGTAPNTNNANGMDELKLGDVVQPVKLDLDEFPTQMEELTTEAIKEFSQKQAEVKSICEEIQALEEQITKHSEEWKQAQSEIRQLDDKINSLKSSDEFINGDETTLSEVKTLQEQLDKKLALRIDLAKEQATKRKKINELKETLIKYGKEYGEEVLIYAYSTKILQLPNDKQHQKTSGKENLDKPKQPSKDKTSHDKEEKTHNSKKNTRQGDRYSSYVQAEPSKTVSKEVLAAEEELEKGLQKRFAELYARVKRGEVTEADFNKLAAVMENGKNYERYNITTGLIFNKGRAMLKAMATIVADTRTTAKLSRKLLGIAAEKASKENGYMPTASIKSWKGLKMLMANPEQKIAAEELCRKIVALDRYSLSKEQLEVVNMAEKHLERFKVLRNSLTVYDSVNKSRMKQKLSWIAEFDEPKTLPKASTMQQELESGVKDVTDNNEIKAKETSKNSPTQEL